MNEIINETILSLNEYIERLPKGCLLITSLLRDDQIVEGLKHISDFSEGAIWIIEASQRLQENNVSITFEMSRILDYLNEINDGLTIGDYNLVADLFEYEISPFFTEIERGAIGD